MTDDFLKKIRRSKEFVYDQWRKLLCFYVIGDDISHNRFVPENVTSEKIRTIFNNGYVLALLQTREALKSESYQCKTNDEDKIIERLLNLIEDRLETQKCLVTYDLFGETYLSDALYREGQISQFYEGSLSTWNDKKM